MFIIVKQEHDSTSHISSWQNNKPTRLECAHRGLNVSRICKQVIKLSERRRQKDVPHFRSGSFKLCEAPTVNNNGNNSTATKSSPKPNLIFPHIKSSIYQCGVCVWARVCVHRGRSSRIHSWSLTVCEFVSLTHDVRIERKHVCTAQSLCNFIYLLFRHMHIT